VSKRRTSAWTPTSEGAFGAFGAKGDRGELIAVRLLTEAGYRDVQRHPDDAMLQKAGIDITLRGHDSDHLITIDTKNNLNKRKYVCIDRPKIAKSNAMYWMHLNDSNPDDYLIYPIEAMRRIIASCQDELARVPRSQVAGVSVDIGNLTVID
jgi:hypothetical protein